MEFFSSLVRATVKTVLTPVAIAKDVVNIVVDSEVDATEKHVESILEDIEDAFDIQFFGENRTIMNIEDKIRSKRKEIFNLQQDLITYNTKARKEFQDKLNSLISQTPTGELREELTHLNILFNIIEI